MRGAILLLCLLAAAPACAQGTPYGKSPEVRAFVNEMVERHGFVERELAYLFSRARRDPAVLRAIEPPKDFREKSWQEYHARFVTDSRIAQGVAFWRAHEGVLARAEGEHGVDAAVIVAILGIETMYGRQTGRFRVIDALATLAFDYPPRAEFFRGQLEQYLLFAREAELDVFSVRGSYAGAIGIPQFMPGSYRSFAVDFDGDGAIDLRRNAADAVGSVANFLARHGWQRGEPVQLAARVDGDAHRKLLEAGIEPSVRLAELPLYGVQAQSGLAPETRVALIDLETPGAATEYRLGLQNFYVLTRYNRSSFYAASVADLAYALRAARKPR